jgi:transcriptional regulator with XRE-family HTH domain
MEAAARAGGDLILAARRAAGLTQTELARRMGTGQSVIARWERGHRSPTYETILNALGACGFELSAAITRGVVSRRAAIERMLRLSPAERMELIAAEGRNMLELDEATR